MPSKDDQQGTMDTHPKWAPAHNVAERRAAIEVAREEARRAAKQQREVLAFARKHRITGQAAQQFLARQRASWRREQARRLARQTYDTAWPHQILCCSTIWQAVPRVPYQLPCCGRVLAFTEETP